MNQIVNNIKQRLSLRKPLAEALETTSKIVEKLSLAKPPVEGDELQKFLKKELDEVTSVVPMMKDFDRDFPSLAFSIATGIGKTRLMGAIIAYLYLQHGIKHFFILAPNLTLYEKLKHDFGDVAYEKYVFKGISEFVSNPPEIVTGETYNGHPRSAYTSLQINIFNISKFNKDTKNGKKDAPKMRRLSEYLGESYFDYLAGLPDLVVLMDEAHRYHADASKKAINELRPILGCEMTATPFDEKGKPFKNIVFEYNLAQALKEGKYVKDPTVAGRKNFDKNNFTPEEIEIIKLEDGISVHERTKVAIELYAKQNDKHVVHPFILVACSDIAHAQRIRELLESDRIYHGKYRGKVLQIDSSTNNIEEIEQQFVNLESSENKIEIVIHVNKLKEGWDVNNLYTIIPLRASEAITLVEQTIGRGLRLPYGGERTGNRDVDTLTVIAHENFADVIRKAHSGDSVLSKLTFVEMDEEELKEGAGKVVTSTPVILEKYQQKVLQAQNEAERKMAERTFDAVRTIIEVLPQVADTIYNFEDLQKPEIIEIVRHKSEELINERAKSTNMIFAENEATEQIAQLDNIIKTVIIDYKKNAIEIPRLIVAPPKVVRKVYEDFDLNTDNGYDFADVNYEILRQNLVTGERDIIEGKSSSSSGNPVDMLVVCLMANDDIDYDTNSDLLYKLAEQALVAIRNNSPNATDDEIAEKVRVYKENVANNIYSQMKAHSRIEYEEQSEKRVLPFSRILTLSLIEKPVGYCMVSDFPKTASLANKYIVHGFHKSYHAECGFDSSTEWDFAYVLETDTKVLKWLRPAPKQFNIYWGERAKQYEPDFIVETSDIIYMCETKASKDMNDDEVQKKAKAAKTYCSIVSEYNANHKGKPWRYVIIPHTAVKRTFSFDYILMSSLML